MNARSIQPEAREALDAVKRAIREPYAWPGGHAVRVYMADGEILCRACALDNFKRIARATLASDCHDSWRVAGAAVLWEGPAEYCCNCGAALRYSLNVATRPRRSHERARDVRPVLRAGCLALADCYQYLVPCKVLSVTDPDADRPGHMVTDAPSMQLVSVRATATRGPYKRGEVFEVRGVRCYPRAAFFQRRHGARIGYYTIEKDPQT